MKLETPHLLVTDDDSGVRSAVCEALRKRGFATLEASDGEEALELLHGRPVHLILVDHHMPRLTGLQLLGRLFEEKIQTPCILMSGALDEQIEAEARRLRAYSVLSKPLRLGMLATQVCTALQRSYGWQGR